MLNMAKVKKVLSASHPQYWTCPRCGTTNNWCNLSCTECKNRRPM